MCLISDPNRVEPSPYENVFGLGYTPPYYLKPMDHFIAGVNSSIRTASPLESNQTTGCWLSALIEMQVFRSVKSLDQMKELHRWRFTVTVLAFIFIPINLVSSVFGMNVQQVNGTGHEIWPFVYTSIVLLALSGLSFLLRHFMKRVLVTKPLRWWHDPDSMGERIRHYFHIGETTISVAGTWS